MVMFIIGLYLWFIVMLLFFMFLSNFSIVVISAKIFQLGFFGDLEIIFSIWSFLFLWMVIMISTSVMFFSFSYMSSYSVNNFLFLYVSFIISMVWLVLSNNFYWVMFGWDGLGVVSFLLIVFYMNHESINNGLFTLFQNRVGDLFFVLFMVGVLSMSMWSSVVLKWGLLFLVIGASVKSAQFPFNSWLLAAMSAPTPISSLVHSSTLVVAGVYILLQYSYCLIDILFVLKFISMLSLLISSFGLLNEFDMKKLIAYSTMSHVSLMMYMMSFKLFKIVYFHLNIHAMFKSLMFMCFGFVMLASFHGQDKRLVSLISLNPLVKITYYFSCLCLAGLPFLSGFFSKDIMIEKIMENSNELFYVFLLLLFLSISVYYSVKLMKLGNVMYPLSMIEKSFMGMFSVFFMFVVMLVYINIFVSLMFSLSFEFLSFKLFIYMLIFFFFILSVFTNLNLKMNVYDKMKNFNEIWMLKIYDLDKFMYWNMFILLEVFSYLGTFKIFLLMNWWVMIIMVVIF